MREVEGQRSFTTVLTLHRGKIERQMDRWVDRSLHLIMELVFEKTD